MRKYNIGSFLKEDKDPSLFRESQELICNETAIGVEIELENIFYNRHKEGYPDLLKLWTYHEDGSLRNGSEFVFKKPFTGENIIRALSLFNDFVEHWDNNNSPITITDRTSIHIHVDVRDMTDEEVLNFTLWYILVERILFNEVSPERIKNNHCVPITDSDFINNIGHISMLRSGRNDYDRAALFLQVVGERCDKYCAFNLLPLRNFGSIEFRHHHGTKDYKDILKWINIILSLKVFASKNIMTESTVLDISLLNKIFNGLVKVNESDPILIQLFNKGTYDVYQTLNYNLLHSDTNTKLHEILAICRVKSQSTMFYKFKKANNLLPSSKEL